MSKWPHKTPQRGILRYAQDFGSRLPLRSRLLSASSSNPSLTAGNHSQQGHAQAAELTAELHAKLARAARPGLDGESRAQRALAWTASPARSAPAWTASPARSAPRLRS